MNLGALITDMYAAFNARDINKVIEQMTEDVDWPNAWEGGRLIGRDAVRDYWTRQWAQIDPRVEPTSFTERPDGSIAVEVDQLVRSLEGDLIGQGTVLHVYSFRDGLIARMDIE
ncbi:MAG: nuclear transport factor 2 family protein [Thermoleophilaceae bacterium]